MVSGRRFPGALPAIQLVGESSLANRLGGIRGTILASASNTGTRLESGSGTGCLQAWRRRSGSWNKPVAGTGSRCSAKRTRSKTRVWQVG